MSGKLTNFINNTKNFLSKHSPEILVGIGVTGMVTSTILAVKATPKAMLLLEQAKNEKGDVLTPVETVKAAWRPYVPATLLSIASMSCIIGASAVNTKRNAALATAYAISERSLLTYRDKVIETIGEKKEKEIKEKIAQDAVNEKPVSNAQVIITSKGNTLCMDSITRRYFRSDLDKIKKVVNELNRDMITQNYVSLNEFYYAVGLDGIKNGSMMGWNVSDGLIELHYSTTLAENDEPCIVIDFETAPYYDFDKFV